MPPVPENQQFVLCVCYLFGTVHINDIIHSVMSCVWLLLLSILFVRIIHAVALISISDFVQLNNIPSYVCSTRYPLINICIVSITWLVWIILLWTRVHVFLLESLFSSFRHIPQCGNARSYGNSMFNFLRNHQTAFHSSWTILYSHLQYTRVLSPHSHYSLWFCLCEFSFFYYRYPNVCEMVPHYSFFY